MAFDSNRQRVVLFGGEFSERLNDTWEWDGNEWVQQADTGPSARVNPAMAYDSIRGRMVLFGGASQGDGLGDTWEWDGAAWTEEADFGPDPCAGATMVFKGTATALFGGIASLVHAADPVPEVFSRSWEWNGKHWTARQDMGPGPRVFHSEAFDVVRSRAVLFGGLPVPPSLSTAASSVLGDTWEQFESGGGGPAVEVVSVVAVPNQVSPGTTSPSRSQLQSAPALAKSHSSSTVGGSQRCQSTPEQERGSGFQIPPHIAPGTSLTITALGHIRGKHGVTVSP
jgi:hypothetical protein